jgi:hypothetical protein
MGKKFIDLSDPETMAARIEHYQKQKQNRIDQHKQEMEIEQLRNCTFEPEIHSESTVKLPEGPIIVRGLGR